MFKLQSMFALASDLVASTANISPTLVIDTSMERSSRVLYHEKEVKNLMLLKKSLTECFCCHVL